jgi:AcrR family transcriptional regulator
VVQVLDEARVRRLTAEHLPRHLAGGRVVDPDERAQEGEALGRVRGRDAGHRDAGPAPDGGRDVAERAGLTKRTFFRYFADKREVLFWGSEIIEQRMVAGIEAAPESASALAMIGAALDAAAVRFEEFRDFAGPRHRIIASSPELQERELIKAASLAAGMARVLRARGLGDTAATVAARTGMIIMQVAFEQWVDDPDQQPFQQIAREALAELREFAAAS